MAFVDNPTVAGVGLSLVKDVLHQGVGVSRDAPVAKDDGVSAALSCAYERKIRAAPDHFDLYLLGELLSTNLPRVLHHEPGLQRPAEDVERLRPYSLPVIRAIAPHVLRPFGKGPPVLFHFLPACDLPDALGRTRRDVAGLYEHREVFLVQQLLPYLREHRFQVIEPPVDFQPVDVRQSVVLEELKHSALVLLDLEILPAVLLQLSHEQLASRFDHIMERNLAWELDVGKVRVQRIALHALLEMRQLGLEVSICSFGVELAFFAGQPPQLQPLFRLRPVMLRLVHHRGEDEGVCVFLLLLHV
mmetsp:Transcript_30735/g.74916  ORF Transcript_30735/g.74916 Transcript_30735/m.74916 type:complete len:302 (+) Transcript_30735:682-1587(+)